MALEIPIPGNSWVKPQLSLTPGLCVSDDQEIEVPKQKTRCWLERYNDIYGKLFRLPPACGQHVLPTAWISPDPNSLRLYACVLSWPRPKRMWIYDLGTSRTRTFLPGQHRAEDEVAVCFRISCCICRRRRPQVGFEKFHERYATDIYPSPTTRSDLSPARAGN